MSSEGQVMRVAATCGARVTRPLIDRSWVSGRFGEKLSVRPSKRGCTSTPARR